MEFKSPVDVVEFRDTTKDLVNRIQIGTQKPKHILGREEKNRGPTTATDDRLLSAAAHKPPPTTTLGKHKRSSKATSPRRK